jgi:hypothetical protein
MANGTAQVPAGNSHMPGVSDFLDLNDDSCFIIPIDMVGRRFP